MEYSIQTTFEGGETKSSAQYNVVNFKEGTKTHDGLCWENDVFNKYMADTFSQKKNRGEYVNLLIKENDLAAFCKIKEKIIDLINRCLESKSNPKKAILLPKGGGTCGNINMVHIPYLRQNIKYLDQVIEKIVDKLKI